MAKKRRKKKGNNRKLRISLAIIGFLGFLTLLVFLFGFQQTFFGDFVVNFEMNLTSQGLEAIATSGRVFGFSVVVPDNGAESCDPGEPASYSTVQNDATITPDSLNISLYSKLCNVQGNSALRGTTMTAITTNNLEIDPNTLDEIRFDYSMSSHWDGDFPNDSPAPPQKLSMGLNSDPRLIALIMEEFDKAGQHTYPTFSREGSLRIFRDENSSTGFFIDLDNSISQFDMPADTIYELVIFVRLPGGIAHEGDSHGELLIENLMLTEIAGGDGGEENGEGDGEEGDEETETEEEVTEEQAMQESPIQDLILGEERDAGRVVIISIVVVILIGLIVTGLVIRRRRKRK